MRALRYCGIIFLFVLLTGCGAGGSNPVSPDGIINESDLELGMTSGMFENGVSGNQSAHTSQPDSHQVLWGIWKLSFKRSDMVVTAVPIRNAATHFDITDMLQPPDCDNCLEIQVNSFDQVERILDVEVTLRNPFQISGNDVRGILYTNDYGHLLTNADDWTMLFDFPGGELLNPFKAYAKGEPNRIFGPDPTEHTEQYLVYIPDPPFYNEIIYAVTASFPNNCKEPYTIEEFSQLGELYDYVGAATELEVYIRDWGDNVIGATLAAPSITGDDFTPFIPDSGIQERWYLTLNNKLGAVKGDYNCQIRAISIDSEDSLYDYVTITVSGDSLTVIEPNGGEALQIGGSTDILWSTIGDIQNVNIEYSADGGDIWNPVINGILNEGSHLWDPIPNDPTDQALIKISDTMDYTVFDVSDDVFSITLEPKNITVIAPDGGEEWKVGSSQEITWSTEGDIPNVKIEYYKDDNYAGTAALIEDSTPNTGSFTWNSIPDDPTITAKVRISDASAPGIYDDSTNFFTIYKNEITVDAPNGGESLPVDVLFDIQWHSTGIIENVKIELSTDGGSTYPETISGSTSNSGTFPWSPSSDQVTDQAIIKISDVLDDNVYDESNDVFEIYMPSSITVIAPNGGENFLIDGSGNIYWASEGIIANVKIEYFKNDDYEGTHVLITPSTENDGIFPWDPIPDDPTTTAKLRISNVIDGTTFDDSDEYFSISYDGDPEVEITNCPPYPVSTWNFQWDMTDDNTHPSELLVRIEKDDQSMDLPPGTKEYEWTGIECPDHTFEVFATDESQNEGTDLCAFDGEDNQNPTVSITNCPPNAVSSWNFQWDMDDDCTDPSNMGVEINIDGGGWIPLQNGADNYQLNSIKCSGRSFQVRVTDESGKTGEDDCEFDGIDNAPSVTITNCPSGTVSSWNAQWTMSDDCTPVSQLHVVISKDGQPLQLPDGTNHYQWNDIQCSNHTFSVEVTDEEGQPAEDECSPFNGPDSDPSVTINNCPDNEVSSWNFNWTMSDDCTLNQNLKVRIWKDGGGPTNLSNGQTSYLWSNISCSDHTFKVEVEDESGKKDDYTCYFDGEDNDPLVSITNCPSKICTNSYNFQWNMNDDCTSDPLLEVEIKKDSQGWQPISDGSENYQWNGITEGSHTFAVRVTDEKDQSDTDTCNFYCDLNKPTISIDYPNTTYNAPCIYAGDSRLSYDSSTGEFIYRIAMSADDPGGLYSVELWINGVFHWGMSTGETSFYEQYDWRFRPNEAYSGYRWNLQLRVEDACGNEENINKEVFAILMPGWPSNSSSVPQCGGSYAYWQDGIFKKGWSDIFGNHDCNVIAWGGGHEANVYESGGDGGQAEYKFELDSAHFSPSNIDELYLVGNTLCDNECASYKWKIGIWNYNIFPWGGWEWTDGLAGDSTWQWKHNDWTNHIWDLETGEHEVTLGIRVDPGVDNWDGVDVRFMGLYITR